MSSVPNWLGNLTTSGGVNPLACGIADVGGSNITVSNALCTTSSIILITPMTTSGGLSGSPSIITRAAGSFTVNNPGWQVGQKFAWFIVKS